VAHALIHGRSAKVVGRTTFVEVGDIQAVVMVATMGAWQIENIDKFVASSTALYILVDFTKGRTDVYTVPGDDLRRGVSERHDDFMRRVDGERPRNPESKHSKIEPADVATWQDRWL